MKKLIFISLVFLISCSRILTKPLLKREMVYQIAREHVLTQYNEDVVTKRITFYRKGKNSNWYVSVYGEYSIYLVDISEEGKVLKSKKSNCEMNNCEYKDR